MGQVAQKGMKVTSGKYYQMNNILHVSSTEGQFYIWYILPK